MCKRVFEEKGILNKKRVYAKKKKRLSIYPLRKGFLFYDQKRIFPSSRKKRLSFCIQGFIILLFNENRFLVYGENFVVLPFENMLFFFILTWSILISWVFPDEHIATRRDIIEESKALESSRQYWPIKFWIIFLF